MPSRTRKFIGTIALLIFLILYVFLAMGVAIVLQARSVGAIGEFLYYLVAGLIWVVPAGLIVQWMQKSPPDQIRR
jgi:FtsH-binding integral membrane protein